MPKLLFSQEIKPSNALIYGTLQLIYPSGEVIDYIACSGATGRQTKELLWKGGAYGAIPPGKYHIPTKGYESNLPGIQGIFFHIQPDPKSDKGERSCLGIHWDGNLPGTAGCIGIKNKDSFNTFCRRLESFYTQGIKTIDLEVTYNDL